MSIRCCIIFMQFKYIWNQVSSYEKRLRSIIRLFLLNVVFRKKIKTNNVVENTYGLSIIVWDFKKKYQFICIWIYCNPKKIVNNENNKLMKTINVYVNHSFKHFIDKELNQNKTLLILKKKCWLLTNYSSYNQNYDVHKKNLIIIIINSYLIMNIVIFYLLRNIFLFKVF